MNIYIFRHGETMNNLSCITQSLSNDIDITERAKIQLNKALPGIVAELGDKVKIFSSPALRAKSTTQPIKDAIDANEGKTAEVEFIDDLHEVDFGVFGGKLEGQLYKRDFKDENGNDTFELVSMLHYRKKTMAYYTDGTEFAYPEGETSAEIHARVANVIDAIRKATKRKTLDTIVIVGHNRFFRHLLVELGIWTASAMFDNKLPHAELVQISDIAIQGYSAK